MRPPATRFAPSPTGHLHAGHLLNALLCWQWKNQTGGKVYLRLEDNDQQRSQPEFEESILEDLEWLGLEPDPLPDGSRYIRQSDNLPYYRQALRQLENQGLLYPCNCPRKTMEKRMGPKPPGKERRYDGYCRQRNLPFETQVTAMRLCLPQETIHFSDQWLGPMSATPANECGDLPLIDRKGNYTYQFTVVVDDQRMGITDIIRGEDILPSTARQKLLQQMLGYHPNIRYWHHPLIFSDQGPKLSKSLASQGLKHWRQQGLEPEEAIQRCLQQAGIPSLKGYFSQPSQK